jgi:hypothetical protein
MQSRAAGFAALDEPAEAAPTVTADRKAPQIALSAMDFKATIIIISSRGLLARVRMFRRSTAVL